MEWRDMPTIFAERTNTESPPSHDNNLQGKKSEDLNQSQRKFVMNVSLVSAILIFTAIVSSIYNLVTNSSSANVLSFLILVAIEISFGVSWYFARRGQVK